MLAPALDHALGIAGGSSPPVGGLLAPDVQAWFASAEQSLVAAIESVRGSDAAAAALARLAPSTLTVGAAVVADDACWAEVTRRGDRGGAETCIVGLTYDDRGAVSRMVWLRAPLAPTPSFDEEGPAPDGRPIVERYLTDLMGSRFREAAAHFTVDTIYSHPPYAGGTERVLFRGREALGHGFATERGPSPVRQIITHFWQRAGRVFVEGVIEGIPDGGTFFSTAQITSEGEIARYVAFYSAERIPACR
ncbi:MAG TPA: hypothetical protein VGF91_32990 [Solirubrobacteraceae bacterium]